MTILGADPEQLDRMAQALIGYADQYSDAGNTLDNWLRRLSWRGAEADRFFAEYESQMRPKIAAAVVTLRSAASELRAQAEDQSRASRQSSIQRQAQAKVDGPPTLRLDYGNAIASGKALGIGIEYRHDFESNLSKYFGTNRGDASVYVAEEIAVNFGDLEPVKIIASVIAGAGIGGVLVAAISPSVEGSIGAGVGKEYRWYNTSQAQNIHSHFLSETTTFANRVDKVGHDDVLRSFENDDVPSAHSEIDWFAFDGEVAAGVGFGFTPNLSAGLELGARVGLEQFSNHDTAYIFQYGVGGSVEGGLGVTGVTNVVAQAGFRELAEHLDIDVDPLGLDMDRIGTGFEWEGESKLVLDDAGVPKTFIVSNSLTTFKSHTTGFPISETDIASQTVSTTYEFDLTDPEVLMAVNEASTGSVNDLIYGANSVERFAEGVRYVSNGDTDQMDIGALWVWDAKQAGSQYSVESAQFKPVGSSEFIDWAEE